MTTEEKLKFFMENKRKLCVFRDTHNTEWSLSSTFLKRLEVDNNGEAIFIDEYGTVWQLAKLYEEKPKSRLMTLAELDGKWITWDGSSTLKKISTVYKDGSCYIDGKNFRSIQDLSDKGGKWSDTPEFDNLKSLEVEA